MKGDLPGRRVADRAHAVPLDLERPPAVLAWQLPGLGEHRDDALGHRLGVGVGRGAHPVDHPVLAGPALVEREERVGAVDALAVQHHLDLVVVPLEDVVGAAVPDRHRPGAVLALGDLAVEVEVLQRVVLGAHRQPVVLGGVGQEVRNRPAGQGAVVLEAQIPVQARGAVLLDDEAQLTRRRFGGAARCGLRGLPEVALVAIIPEPVGHLDRREGTFRRRGNPGDQMPVRELAPHQDRAGRDDRVAAQRRRTKHQHVGEHERVDADLDRAHA